MFRDLSDFVHMLDREIRVARRNSDAAFPGTKIRSVRFDFCVKYSGWGKQKYLRVLPANPTKTKHDVLTVRIPDDVRSDIRLELNHTLIEKFEREADVSEPEPVHHPADPI